MEEKRQLISILGGHNIVNFTGKVLDVEICLKTAESAWCGETEGAVEFQEWSDGHQHLCQANHCALVLWMCLACFSSLQKLSLPATLNFLEIGLSGEKDQNTLTLDSCESSKLYFHFLSLQDLYSI